MRFHQLRQLYTFWAPRKVRSAVSGLHALKLNARWLPSGLAVLLDWQKTGLAYALAVSVVCLLGINNAWAYDAQLAKGLAWLQGEVQSDGRLASEGSSTAIPFQTRSEVVSSFRELAVSPPSKLVTAAQSAAEVLSVEVLARRVIAMRAAGKSVDTHSAQLIAQHNANGGFGAMAGYESTPLDSAWALLALENTATHHITASTVNWLLNSQQEAGYWSLLSGEDDIVTTAIVVHALQKHRQVSGVSIAIDKARTWLLSKRQGVSWRDAQQTARSLIAVLPGLADTTPVKGALDSLASLQQANGSWNADPYLTAIALRALFTAKQGAEAPGAIKQTGALQGMVSAAGTQTPLYGATIMVLSTVNGVTKATQTGQDGHYEITGIPAGAVEVTAFKSGYSTVYAVGQVPIGSSLTFSPALLSAVAVTPPSGNSENTVTVKGQVISAQTGSALTGATVELTHVDSGKIHAATSAFDGSYHISNIQPGALTLRASAIDHISAHASATLQAGETAVFSPELVLKASARQDIELSGQVVDDATKQPLEGVAVVVKTASGQQTTMTGINGHFSMTVPVGELSLMYSKSGYGTLTQSAVSVAGARLDAGIVEMSEFTQNSVLFGVVRDLEGHPVKGALIDIEGVSTTTNAGGAYFFEGLTGLRWNIRVSATGYQLRSHLLTITEPGRIQQDFSLATENGPSLLDLLDFQAAPQIVGLNADVTAQLIVRNSSASAVSSGILLEVISEQGETQSLITPLDTLGLPLGNFDLAPGEEIPVRFEWNSGSFAAGLYTLHVKLYQPGSRDTDNPAGLVTGSDSTGLRITPEPLFDGVITTEPPVAQAGANTPVSLTALVRNTGNVILGAAHYKLQLIDSDSQAVLHEVTRPAAALALSELTELDFGTWTPTGAGSLELRITSGVAPHAKAVSTLYVGDMAEARFTTTPSIVPPGDQVVKGQIAVSGIDMATGTSTDPLVPVIREAITKAVHYADDYAYKHYINDLKCFACHVQTQALVGGEKNLRFTEPVQSGVRVELLNSILQNMDAGGVVQSSTGPQANTLLALWASKTWHEPEDIKSSNRKLAEAVIKSANDGQWSMDYKGSWWGTTGQATSINASSLMDYAKLLEQHGAGEQTILQPAVTVTGSPAGEWRMVSDDTNHLYVASASSAGVYTIPPAMDQATLLIPGLRVNNIRLAGNGDLIIAAQNGVYRSDTAGNVTQLSSTPASDASESPNGTIVFRASSGTLVYQIDGGGIQTTLINNSALDTQGRQLWVESSGDMLITTSQNRLLRFEADGTFKEVVLNYFNGASKALVPYQDGYLLTTQNGLFYYNQNWVVERLLFSNVSGVTAMPDGRVFVRQAGLHELLIEPADAVALQSRLATVIDRAMGKLTTGQIISHNDNLEQAFRLMALAKAKNYYAGTARANTFDSLINSTGVLLWSRQQADGGWTRSTSYRNSDPTSTAIIGLALEALSPSRNDPNWRKAVTYVLGAQAGDGTWTSTNGLGGKLLSSTWVEIWLPDILDRLGALDVELAVNFPKNVTPTGIMPAPVTAGPNADGTTRYTWQFAGITNQVMVDFDLALADMLIDETRPVAHDATLVFENSFIAGNVTVPIDIPWVAVNAGIDIAAHVSKPRYRNQETAQFFASVTNTGVGTRQAQVRLTVQDEQGDTVSVLDLPPVLTLNPGQTGQAQAPWLIDGILAGHYTLQAELVSPQGVVYGSATAPFEIIAGPGVSNTAHIATDKADYLTTQIIRITSRGTNNSSNMVQSNLRLESAILPVTRAPGPPVRVWNESITQLRPGRWHEPVYTLPAGALPAGAYQARARLYDSQGTLLSESTTGFSVQEFAVLCSASLNGQLTVAPTTVSVNEHASMSLRLTNSAATALTGANVSLGVFASDTGTALFEQHINNVETPGSGVWNQTFNWKTTASTPASVTVVALLEMPGGCQQVLATQSLKIRGGTGSAPNPPVNAIPVPVNQPWALALAVLALLLSARCVLQRHCASTNRE